MIGTYKSAMARAVGELAEEDPQPSPTFAVPWPAVLARMSNYIPGGEVDEDVAIVAREELEGPGYLEGEGNLAAEAMLKEYFEEYHPLWRQEVRDVAACLTVGDSVVGVAERAGHSVKKTALMFQALQEDRVIECHAGEGGATVALVNKGRLKTF